MYHLTPQTLDWFFRPSVGTKVARYPLTNLGVDENNKLLIEVAIAGFNKNDVELELKGNQLFIRGTKTDVVDNKIKYIQQHISSSSFERVIILHENYVGGDITAKFVDGILSINVEPKEQSKKLIAISE